jgi:hypothetical protein
VIDATKSQLISDMADELTRLTNRLRKLYEGGQIEQAGTHRAEALIERAAAVEFHEKHYHEACG